VAANRCPVCRTTLWAPVADAMGSKDCPRCGAELWVFIGSVGPIFVVRQPGQSALGFLASLAAKVEGTTAGDMEAALKSADRFDLIELVTELEDALDDHATNANHESTK
jgi:hypothetical protein